MNAPTTPPGPRAGRLRGRRARRSSFLGCVLLFALVTVLGVFTPVLAGCGSLSKPEVEARLLALGKNAAVAGALREHPARILLEGEEREVVFRYAHFEARDGGAAGHAPLVLVHGTPASLFDWAGIVQGPPSATGAAGGLAAERDVYALDVLGHGLTECEIDRHGFQSCADWVVGFVRALELDDVVLVGHSYGGEFAWRAALDEPDRIAKLVLVDSAGYRREDGAWLPEEEAMRELTLARYGYFLNSRDRVRSAYEVHFREPLADDLVDEMFTLCENKVNWGAMVDLVRDEEGHREAEIAEISQPTLLLWGAEDVAYPPDTIGRRFEGDIPVARLVTVAGAGHYPHLEQPAEFLAELEAFLE